jgi:hypothetical protein
MQNRIPVIQRISQSVRKGIAVDIYALVRELKGEFPGVSETELERIVSEEVIFAEGCAVWDKH